MNCKNCGRQNPSGSLYCQDCGHRLGDWVPPERPGRMPTPPTGIARGGGGEAAAPSATATISCPRCAAVNAGHMRFCNNCGFAFQPAVGAPIAAPASPASDAAFSQGAMSGYPAAQPPSAGQVCWRCRAAGDLGAEFCKFCGARYAEDPAKFAAAAPAVAPASPVAPAPSLGSAVAAYAAAAPSAAPSQAYGQPAFGHGVRVPSAPPPRNDAPPSNGVEGQATPRALLVAILKDGSDGRIYPVHEEQTDIGRTEGHLVLGDDPYLSPRHARVLARGGDQIVVRDLDSLNGLYVRLRDPVDLQDGDMVLLGQQVMRFEVLSDVELPLGPATHRGVLVFGTPEVPRLARLVQYTTEGVGRDVHYLYRDETVIGREQGDIVCTDDPFMSRRHAAITLDRTARRFVLRDLGSSNGTAVRIRGERTLRPGDQFRVGRHLFRYDSVSARDARADQFSAGQGRSGA